MRPWRSTRRASPTTLQATRHHNASLPLCECGQVKFSLTSVQALVGKIRPSGVFAVHYAIGSGALADRACGSGRMPGLIVDELRHPQVHPASRSGMEQPASAFARLCGAVLRPYASTGIQTRSRSGGGLSHMLDPLTVGLIAVHGYASGVLEHHAQFRQTLAQR